MSLIFEEHKVLFLHQRKTGGEYVKWVSKELRIPCKPLRRRSNTNTPMNHRPLGMYRPGKIDVFGVFTFVRHPRAWYESCWKWIKTNNLQEHLLNKDWDPLRVAVVYWDDDFDKWVENMLVNVPMWYSRLIDLYCGPKGGEFANFIGRTETLREDFHRVLQLMGYKFKIEEIPKQKQNVTPYPEKIKWDTGLLDWMLLMEKEVVERFYEDNFEKTQFSKLCVNRSDVRTPE